MAIVLFIATMAIIATSRRMGPQMKNYGMASYLTSQGAATLTGRKPIGLGIFAIVVAILLVGPALVLIPLSFTADASFVFPPRDYSMRWYENFFSSRDWMEALSASLKIAFVTTIAATLIGGLAAFGIVRGRSRAASLAEALILVPRVVPAVIVAVAVYAVFLRSGLSSTYTGFVLAHTALAIPFVVLMVSAGIRNFDERLELAAASLGSSPIRRFFRVTLPLVWPGIASGAVLAFITSFDEVIVSLFLQGAFLRTLPVVMFSSIQDRIDPTIAVASTLTLCLATGLVATNLFLRKGNGANG